MCGKETLVVLNLINFVVKSILIINFINEIKISEPNSHGSHGMFYTASKRALLGTKLCELAPPTSPSGRKVLGYKKGGPRIPQNEIRPPGG